MLLTQSRGARTIAERVLAYDDAGRLFGVLAQPTEPIGRRARTAMLLLNVGSNHHIGPHRMYVTLSRELAALGFSAFRLDVAGLGESARPSGGKENSLYAHQSILDVQQAMTFLTRIIDAERFVLCGICSGAYLAFHATAADPRVSGQILVNPQTFEWREGRFTRAQDQEGELQGEPLLSPGAVRQGHLVATLSARDQSPGHRARAL